MSDGRDWYCVIVDTPNGLFVLGPYLGQGRATAKRQRAIRECRRRWPSLYENRRDLQKIKVREMRDFDTTDVVTA